MGEIMNKINEDKKQSSNQNYLNIIKINKLKSNPKIITKKKI
jgi:hypothetical protein